MADGAAACSSGGVRFIDVVGEIPKGDNDVLLVVMVGCAIAHSNSQTSNQNFRISRFYHFGA
jgi:hypothetical protein